MSLDIWFPDTGTSRIRFSRTLPLVVCLALAVLGGTPVRAVSVELTLVQPQFLVNSYTLKGQHHATVDMDDQGLFLVSWNTHSSDWMEVKARAYYADGLPWTSEFPGNKLVVAGAQYSPDVATGGGADWVVTWPSTETATTTWVYAKIYSSAAPQDRLEFKVDPGSQPSVIRSRPDAAMFPNGDFIVVWDHAAPGDSVLNYFVRMFDHAGNPLGERVKINQSDSDLPPTDHTGTPDIVVQDVGGRMIAFASWKRWHTHGAEWSEVLGRKFDPYTMVFDDEFVINPVDSGVHQGRPMVDMNGQGDILVVWQELNPADDMYDIHTRKYTAATDTWGGLIDPPGNDQYEQHRAHGLLSESGGMMLGWTRIEPGNGFDNVYLMAYDPDGVPLLVAPEMVNTTTSGIQRRPALGMTESGGNTHLVVIWESNNDDGSDYGVMGAVYDFNGFADMSAKRPFARAEKSLNPVQDFGLDPQQLNPRERRSEDRADASLGPVADFSSYPNPFNPTTSISFSLGETAPVSLDIHDLAGRRVRSLVTGETYPAGSHVLTWHGRDEGGRPAASGIYFLRLTVGEQTHLKRITLAR